MSPALHKRHETLPQPQLEAHDFFIQTKDCDDNPIARKEEFGLGEHFQENSIW